MQSWNDVEERYACEQNGVACGERIHFIDHCTAVPRVVDVIVLADVSQAGNKRTAKNERKTNAKEVMRAGGGARNFF